MQGWMGNRTASLNSVCWGSRDGAAASGHPVWEAESRCGGCSPLLWGELRFGGEKSYREKGKAMLQAEVRHLSLRRRRNRTRAAVRKRMGVRMKMRTRAVKRAWWIQTQMQRRRVKHGATHAVQGMGVHSLVSPGTGPGKGESTGTSWPCLLWGA